MEVHIDSPGGELLAGLSIYNELRPHNPTVHIKGLAGSIASVIALSGDVRRIEKSGQVAIHNAQQVLFMDQGDQNHYRKIANDLEMLSNTIMDIYEERTNLDRATLKALMDAETMFPANEAINSGFATELNEVQLVAKINYKEMSKLMDLITGKQNNMGAPDANVTDANAAGITNEVEEQEEVTFSEAQMNVLGDMINNAVATAMANVPSTDDVANAITSTLNQIKSTGTPDQQTEITEVGEVDSLIQGMQDFNNAKNRIVKNLK